MVQLNQALTTSEQLENDVCIYHVGCFSSNRRWSDGCISVGFRWNSICSVCSNSCIFAGFRWFKPVFLLELLLPCYWSSPFGFSSRSSSSLWLLLNFIMQQLLLIEWLCFCSDSTSLALSIYFALGDRAPAMRCSRVSGSDAWIDARPGGWLFRSLQDLQLYSPLPPILHGSLISLAPQVLVIVLSLILCWATVALSGLYELLYCCLLANSWRSIQSKYTNLEIYILVLILVIL
jgi:hypothetical protein